MCMAPTDNPVNGCEIILLPNKCYQKNLITLACNGKYMLTHKNVFYNCTL